MSFMPTKFEPLKFLKGYRTFIASGLTILFGTLSLVDWNSFFNDPKAGATAIITALIFAGLRFFTTTPPGQSEHPDTKVVEKLPMDLKEEIRREIKPTANTTTT